MQTIPHIVGIVTQKTLEDNKLYVLYFYQQDYSIFLTVFAVLVDYYTSRTFMTEIRYCFNLGLGPMSNVVSVRT